MAKKENITNETVETTTSAEPIKPKQKRATTPTAIYPDKPTRIVSIDSQYIRDYFKGEYEAKRIDADTIREFSALSKKLVGEKGERAYFQPYRNEFVKRFFPELDKNRKKANQESMADFLDNLLK